MATIQATSAAARASVRETGRWLWDNPALLTGGMLLASVVALAVFAPLLTPYDPIAQDLLNARQPPSLAHPFGTDHLGRDMLTRVL